MIDPLSLPPVTEQDREPAAGIRKAEPPRPRQTDEPRPHRPNAETPALAWEAFDAEGQVVS